MSDVVLPPPPPPPPPPPAAPPEAVRPPQFDFAKPFTYVFEDPRWLQKVLVGGLFYLAGFLLIGWIFLLGYYAKTVRNVVAGHAYPLPEWDDLGAFFNEGLRLFAVALAYTIPVIVISIAVMIPAGIFSSFDNEGLQVLGSGIATCLTCLIVPFVLAVVFIMPASLLFVMVEQNFNAAFDFSRIWAFVKANIGNYLLALVVAVIANHIGGFGVVLLCIGIIFTAFWSYLISAHAYAQVWRLANPPAGGV